MHGEKKIMVPSRLHTPLICSYDFGTCLLLGKNFHLGSLLFEGLILNILFILQTSLSPQINLSIFNDVLFV